MRALFIVILVAALAWVGWTFRAKLADTARQIAPFSGSPSGESESGGPATGARTGGKVVGGPGTYFATERVASHSKTGVKALNPGDRVQLMYRYKDGRVLVTNGRDEFVVEASALSKERPQ